MNISDYQTQALTTLAGNHAYGDINAQLMAQVLGLLGESGEVAEKFKKLIRDKKGVMGDEDKAEIVKELGDILWCLATISHLLGVDLEEVARINNEKLAKRKQENVIAGSGDNRWL